MLRFNFVPKVTNSIICIFLNKLVSFKESKKTFVANTYSLESVTYALRISTSA